MKRLLFVILVIVSFNANALLYLEGAVGIGLGSAEISETSGSDSYTHESTQFSQVIDLRAGLSKFGVSAGGLYSAGQFYLYSTRNDNGDGRDRNYENGVNYHYLGFFLGYNIPVLPFRVWAEYYADANLSLRYAESKSSNPFSKNDELEGSGYGVGLAFKFLPWVSTYVMYKKLSFDTWKNSGVTRNLPDANFSELDVSHVMFGAMLSVDLF